MRLRIRAVFNDGDLTEVNVQERALGALPGVLPHVESEAHLGEHPRLDQRAHVAGALGVGEIDLEGEPAKVNAEPTGAGWFVKLKLSNTAELKDLMSEAAYNDYVKGL